MKAEPNWLISQKLTENLEHLLFICFHKGLTATGL